LAPTKTASPLNSVFLAIDWIPVNFRAAEPARAGAVDVARPIADSPFPIPDT
jgi:hypothetical protein